MASNKISKSFDVAASISQKMNLLKQNADAEANFGDTFFRIIAKTIDRKDKRNPIDVNEVDGIINLEDIRDFYPADGEEQKESERTKKCRK